MHSLSGSKTKIGPNVDALDRGNDFRSGTVIPRQKSGRIADQVFIKVQDWWQRPKLYMEDLK